MKVTRVGGRISLDRLPPGGQAIHGWLAPRGATCPGGKINWDTGNYWEIGSFPTRKFLYYYIIGIIIYVKQKIIIIKQPFIS